VKIKKIIHNRVKIISKIAPNMRILSKIAPFENLGIYL